MFLQKEMATGVRFWPKYNRGMIVPNPGPCGFLQD